MRRFAGRPRGLGYANRIVTPRRPTNIDNACSAGHARLFSSHPETLERFVRLSAPRAHVDASAQSVCAVSLSFRPDEPGPSSLSFVPGWPDVERMVPGIALAAAFYAVTMAAAALPLIHP